MTFTEGGVESIEEPVIQKKYAELGLDMVLDTLISDGLIKMNKDEIYFAIMKDGSGKTSREVIILLNECKQALKKIEDLQAGEVELEELLTDRANSKVNVIKLTIAEKVSEIMGLIRRTRQAK